MSRLSTVLFGCAILTIVACSQSFSGNGDEVYMSHSLAMVETASGDNEDGSFAGHYLAAIIAQRNHDWQAASRFINKVLDGDANNEELKSRAMILAMGAGDYEQALSLAHDLKDNEKFNAISRLILTMHAIKKGAFDEASKEIERIESDKKVELVRPVINAWIEAGQGKFDSTALAANPLYVFDALNMAALLENKEKVGAVLNAAIENKSIITEDLEKIGDILYLNKLNDEALALFKKALSVNLYPAGRIAEKIMLLEKGRPFPKEILTATASESIQHGTARSLYDIATLLFDKGADNSARLFTSMALYLDQDFSQARFLMGKIIARSGQFDEALQQFSAISPEDKVYIMAKRESADILEQANQHLEAIKILNTLANEYGDLEARIQIGDIHRRKENFEDAVDAYNNAFAHVSNPDDPSTWHLYYVRGMALERLGNWESAERDLKKALEFRPDHPYILNYLGYSWADQGTNLEKALKMIRRAVKLRPDDGYIVDSLGWVLFRMGKVEEARKYLEQAVELLPYDPVINDHLGDVYWSVGRRTEAKFQWRRALDYAEDQKLVTSIKKKISDGLQKNTVMEAMTNVEESTGYNP